MGSSTSLTRSPSPSLRSPACARTTASTAPSLTRRNSRSNSLSPSKGELVRKKSLLSAAPKDLPHVIHPTDFGHIGLLPNIEDKPLFHAYHKSDYGLADIVVKPTEGSTIRVLGRSKGRVNLD